MNKKKIFFFRIDSYDNALVLPMVMFSFKRYYELNSKYANDWEWIMPLPSYVNLPLETLICNAVEHNADIYCLSSYVWSWSIVKKIAIAIKQQLPNAKVILGGPHQGTTYSTPMLYFRKHHYFDAACSPTEFGEMFMLDMLDSISENRLDWDMVRNSVHPKGRGPIADKRDFKFPSDVISTNLEEILQYQEVAQNTNLKLVLIYETTRGCPYGCTYCEWGGGINSKVISKSLQDLANDLEIIKKLKIDIFYIADANFGILKEDVIKSNMIADAYKDSNYKFETIFGGLAKTNKQKRIAVLEPLLACGSALGYNMSIQTINKNALINVDRTDVSVEENTEVAKYLIEKYNSGIHVEFILGLPGYTLDDFYEEFNIIYKSFNNHAGISRGPMLVLPDSPSANPSYLEKFKIILAPAGIETSDGEIDHDKYYNVITDAQYVDESTIYFPVSCYSFSKDDWKQMQFMVELDVLFREHGFFKPFIDYIMHHSGITPEKAFRRLFKVFSSITQIYNPLWEYVTEITEGKKAYIDWRLDNTGENITISLFRLWEQNIDIIYNAVRLEFSNILTPMLEDLLSYLIHSSFKISGEDSVWSTKWDWVYWESTNNKNMLPSEEAVVIVSKPRDVNFKYIHPHAVRITNSYILDPVLGLRKLKDVVLPEKTY